MSTDAKSTDRWVGQDFSFLLVPSDLNFKRETEICESAIKDMEIEGQKQLNLLEGERRAAAELQ